MRNIRPGHNMGHCPNIYMSKPNIYNIGEGIAKKRL